MFVSCPLAWGSGRVVPLGDLFGVPWMPTLTTLCPQADAMEGSLMGFPGERGPPGLKGVKVRVQMLHQAAVEPESEFFTEGQCDNCQLQ